MCVLNIVVTCYRVNNIAQAATLDLYDGGTWFELRVGGTRYRSWLRHYATSRKVSCSILDKVI
jgi:hypothetical protein